MVINPIVGVYIPIIRIPIKKNQNNHPQQNATFDHGTYITLQIQAEMPSLLALVIEAMQKHASAPEVRRSGKPDENQMGLGTAHERANEKKYTPVN